MPDSSPILDWEKFRITWRGGIFEMNPDPNDYGGQDIRKFCLEQYEYMLVTRQYDVIDQRLILSPHSSDKPVKVIKEADQLENVKFPEKKRKRKKRRR